MRLAGGLSILTEGVAQRSPFRERLGKPELPLRMGDQPCRQVGKKVSVGQDEGNGCEAEPGEGRIGPQAMDVLGR